MGHVHLSETKFHAREPTKSKTTDPMVPAFRYFACVFSGDPANLGSFYVYLTVQSAAIWKSQVPSTTLLSAVVYSYGKSLYDSPHTITLSF
jgi:hypothetical protein